VTDFVVLACVFQGGHQRSEQEIRRSEDEIDLGVGIQRVPHAVQRLVLTPFRRHAGHHFDRLGKLGHRVLESVPASHRVDVPQIADQDHRPMPAPGAFFPGLLGHIPDRGLGQFVVVGHHDH
jgi:hypothetical protein